MKHETFYVNFRGCMVSEVSFGHRLGFVGSRPVACFWPVRF